MKRVIAIVTIVSALAVNFSCYADTLKFLCSWEKSKPIEIVVDTDTGKATRNDGGYEYSVIKSTKWAIWLLVEDSKNVSAAAIQMIQRKDAIKPADTQKEWNEAGKWVDIISSFTGTVSPIDGGLCWEMDN